MTKHKSDEVTNKEVNIMIQDIRMFLVGNKNYEFETN